MHNSEILMLVTSLCIGITLSAAAGMRVFLPLFLAGLVIRFQWLPLPGGIVEAQAWLGSNAALICFGVATITEAIAYKVPYLDHLLDVIAAPAALIAGAVLATTFLLGIEDPVLKYSLGIIAGAGSAGIVHGATAMARVTSTKTTAGIANPFFAIAEFFGSAITTLFAFVVPVVGAILVLTFVMVVLIIGRKLLKRGQKQIKAEN